MENQIRVWGSGAAFGRELGNPEALKRPQRDQTALSIFFKDLHILIDAGAPCTEKMINAKATPPDLLLITHPHNDHLSDLDKLIFSRKRGYNYAQSRLKQGKSQYPPFPIVGTEECIHHEKYGLKKRYPYLDSVAWTPFPAYDAWYLFTGKESIATNQTEFVSPLDSKPPLAIKALPVSHSSHGPGSCLYIIKLGTDHEYTIVISGDFESMDKAIINHPDLKDPDVLLLETNTLYSTGTHHTNWEKNTALINTWFTGQKTSTVILYHISGYEDWEQGYFDIIPDDITWQREINKFNPPSGCNIEIATDGGCYTF